MQPFRGDISKYYENLKSEIDVHCENLLLNGGLTESKKKTVNSQRESFIKKIDQIHEENLKIFSINVESINDENKNQILFNGKFCFFIPRTNSSKQIEFFWNNRFGKLFITNQFVSKTTIDTLNEWLNEKNEAKNLIRIPSKDFVMLNLILDLLEHRSKELDMIDLSITSNNQIRTFELRDNTIEEFGEDDLALVETMVNKNVLKRCILAFSQVTRLPRKILSPIDWIEDIVMRSNESAHYEPSSFECLKTLKILNISNIGNKTIDIKFTNSMSKSLIQLQLTFSEIENLNDNVFSHFKNLQHLSLNSNRITEITSQTFKGLTNLHYLDLSFNQIEYLEKDAFQDLKSLKCLAMHNSLRLEVDADYFNCLENLEILEISEDEEKQFWPNLNELNLPKLKYLGFNSKTIPKFENMKLEFLTVVGLECLDKDSFKHYQHLKGFRLETYSTLLDKITNENFSDLKSLSYLHVIFDNLSQEEGNTIKNKRNYYEEFLCRPSNLFSVHYESSFDLEVSCYEKMNEFLKDELGLNETTADILYYLY